jgi:uncharacterized membrane protein
MSDDASRALFHAAWVFWALGPQLVICLLLGYAAAKRSGGSLLNWLIVGFLAAVVPLVGVVVMVVLMRRATVVRAFGRDEPQGRTE